jgi:hypothetical protein
MTRYATIKNIAATWLSLLCLTANPLALSQALEPRSYTNVPIGQTFTVLGALRSEGELTPTATSPLQDAEMTIDAAVVGFAHSFSLAGKSAKFDMAATRQCFEGSGVFRGEFAEARRCGYGAASRAGWDRGCADLLARE